jgi:uncharacterized protein YndB with AHSA1/START domain
MNAPLRLSFEVACPVDHAFSVWTEQIGRWWPKDHTVSGADDAEVIMEAGVGGRVYERTSDGVERDWGEVRGWDPPESLVYLWHIGQDRAEATEVEIRFLAQGAEHTRVEIEHRGWERLGSRGTERRARNQSGWESVLADYQAAAEEGTN